MDASTLHSIPKPHSDLAHLGKKDFLALADGLIVGDQWSIDRCVEFVVSETGGFWHGRARAMMCRRLKHCALGRSQRIELIKAITERLATGAFSEQFKDQLRLAMHLGIDATFCAAQKALTSKKSHVVRYAHWVLSHESL